MGGDLSKFFMLDNEVGAGAERRKFNLLDPDCISALETALAMIPNIGMLSSTLSLNIWAEWI